MLRAYDSPRPALSYQELSASNLKAAAETSSVGDSVLGVYSLSTLPPLTYFSQQPLASLIMMLAWHESPSPGLSYREPHASDLNAGAEKSPVGGCQRFHFGVYPQTLPPLCARQPSGKGAEFQHACYRCQHACYGPHVRVLHDGAKLQHDVAKLQHGVSKSRQHACYRLMWT